jgi:hypothetical protein
MKGQTTDLLSSRDCPDILSMTMAAVSTTERGGARQAFDSAALVEG